MQACYRRHRHQEFLAFLKLVARAHPRVKLHVVCDNYPSHKPADSRPVPIELQRVDQLLASGEPSSSTSFTRP